MILYYRNSLEVFQSLFGAADFAGFMDFEPRKVWTNNKRLHRIYSGIMTGDWAWRAQVSGELYVLFGV